MAAHQQKMRAGGLALSQGTRRILQERERHARKAGQAAAALTASSILDPVSGVDPFDDAKVLHVTSQIFPE